MANNNEQSDLGDNKVTGNATQRSAGRGAVDSRALPVLDATALFNFATICAPAKVGTSANVAAPAELTATEKPAPLEPKDSGESPQRAREAQAKDAIIEGLRHEITEHVAAKRSLKTELEQAAARVAGLIAGLAERDAALTQGSSTLEGIQQASAALQSQLASSGTTVEQLTSVVQQNRLAAADTARRYEDQVAASNELRAKIQQLESYIDDRSQSWSVLNAKVAEHKDALASLEATVAAKDAQLAAHTQQTERLTSRIRELEHQVRSAAKETTQLKDEIAAREQLVKRFKGSAQKLNRLGASLEGLDRKLSSASAQILSSQLRLRALQNNAPAVKPVDRVSVASETPCRKIIVAVDGEVRVNHPLRKNDMTIGRAPASDIRIPRAYVSRTHARIFMRGDRTFIEDLGSRNGVFVNYKVIKQSTELHDGDVIGLGDDIDLGGVPELKYIDLDRPATSGRTTPASPRVTRTPHP